jgi:phage-related protein
MAGQIGMMVTGLAALNAGLLLAKIRTVATTVATGAATAAQWLFNTAMSANPIALVIIAIAAIAAGLIYAYKHSEKFRAIVNAVGKAAARAFGWVVDKLKDVWNWIKSKWPLLKAILMGPIGAAVSWIVKHWDQIKEGARKAVDGIKSGFAGAFHAIIDPIDRAFRWAMGKLSAIKDGWGNIIGKLPGFAHGGIVGAASGGPRSGMTWVGENGPELVKLPAGSHVRSHGDSMRTASGGGVATVILEVQSTGSSLDDFIVELIRKAVRVKGGDVQLVLGRG